MGFDLRFGFKSGIWLTIGFDLDSDSDLILDPIGLCLDRFDSIQTQDPDSVVIRFGHGSIRFCIDILMIFRTWISSFTAIWDSCYVLYILLCAAKYVIPPAIAAAGMHFAVATLGVWTTIRASATIITSLACLLE